MATFINATGSYCAVCKNYDKITMWCDLFDTVAGSNDFCSFGKSEDMDISKEKKDEN